MKFPEISKWFRQLRRPDPDIEVVDRPVQIPAYEQVEKAGPSRAIGVTGLKRWGDRGLVNEEFLRDLSGSRGYKKFREMRDNDPVVGAVLFAIEMLIRNVSWRVEGGTDEANELVESCMYDMGTSWANTMAEILSMLPFGWSLFELTYKRRGGVRRNALEGSKHSDGKIGWKNWSLRGQDTLYEWVWDEDGEVAAFVQTSPPRTTMVEIPMERCLLFRTGVHKNNPEGRSILRNAYKPWYYAEQLSRIEAIGIERDLAGLPVMYASERAINAYESVLRQIVSSVKRDENEGLLIPKIVDPATGEKEIELVLLSAAGSRQINISEAIQRYQRLITISVMADFVMLGHEKVGSLALASSKTSMFALAVGAILESIANEINDREIPRLLRYNGMPADEPPRLVPGDIEKVDPKEMAAFLTAISGAGVLSTPDDDLENYLREMMGLPMKPEDDMARPNPRMAAPPDNADMPEQAETEDDMEDVEDPEDSAGDEPVDPVEVE